MFQINISAIVTIRKSISAAPKSFLSSQASFWSQLSNSAGLRDT